MKNDLEGILNMITDILAEMGFVIFDDIDNDFDLRDYIIDSLQYMQFIVSIEEKLGIQLEDEFLSYDIISSIHGFGNKILYTLNEIKDV